MVNLHKTTKITRYHIFENRNYTYVFIITSYKAYKSFFRALEFSWDKKIIKIWYFLNFFHEADRGSGSA